MFGALPFFDTGSSAIPFSVVACDRDLQCGGGTCCAVTLWLRSLRICTPMGNEGDECHPLSYEVPYIGKRMHHTCPCLPNLICVRFGDGQYRCLSQFKIEGVFF
ncbi:toxin MIT1-like isoform X2 [Scyliorhinus canicula]|uniref:toxin MIT1-like isoform X2 n=1 Tax=Scyliorhinus canicula TaxID=7830 RepID=UPI0018F477C7|nr:toxin MIT1-like isoform X2 [Scyliorhinus canicula]